MLPQPVSPTIRVTRFSRIFPTIFSLIAVIGKGGNVDDDEDENPDENGSGSEDECDEVGDEDISSDWKVPAVGRRRMKWRDGSKKNPVC